MGFTGQRQATVDMQQPAGSTGAKRQRVHQLLAEGGQDDEADATMVNAAGQMRAEQLASAGLRQGKIDMQQAEGGSDTKRRRVQQPTATGDQDTAMEGRLAAAGHRQSSIDMTHAAGTAGHDAAAAQMRQVSITGDHSIRQDAEAQPQSTKRKKRGKRRNAHQPSATTLSKYD